MTSEQTEVVIFSDNDGNFYMVPNSVLHEYRVAETRAAEIRELVDGQEVSGYMHPMITRAARTVARSLEANSQHWAAMYGYYLPVEALPEYLAHRPSHHSGVAGG